MSTLEKFGILVILILVVIIGVVAVWGVGGNEGANPFEPGTDVAEVATAPAPSGDLPPWPGTTPSPAPTVAGPVAPPPVEAPVTAPSAPALTTGPSPAIETGGDFYVVEKGDTYTKIAQKLFGDGNQWTRIRDANPGKDPKRLKIGDRLSVPAGSGVAQAPPPVPTAPRPPVSSFGNLDDGPTGPAPVAAPAAGGTRDVVVEDGDSFWKISERVLGDGRRFKEIEDLNPGVPAKRLRKGMTIKVPAAE